jgi:hypothetical protein
MTVSWKEGGKRKMLTTGAAAMDSVTAKREPDSILWMYI